MFTLTKELMIHQDCLLGRDIYLSILCVHVNVAIDPILSSADILFSIFLVSLLPDDNMNLLLEEQVFC